jgi:hypothetical protein
VGEVRRDENRCDIECLYQCRCQVIYDRLGSSDDEDEDENENEDDDLES